MRKLFLLLVISLALAACGSDDNSSGVAAAGTGESGNPSSTENPGNAATASAVDAFTARVMALVATNPEHTEAEAIESVVVTTPDNTEPTPII
jgi:hypothetical protein